MATNTTKGNSNGQTTNNHGQKNTEQDSQDEARLRDDIDLDNVDPDEEVTPKNVQVPPDDEDKDRQNAVLQADHIRLGFPADGVPRTDEERGQMEEAGLLDKK